MINLSRLPPGEVFFVGLPLPLAGLDGSPVRAAAIVGVRSHASPEMSTHDNWKMRNVFVTTFQEILDGKYTPAVGMRKAQAEIEKILVPYQK